MADVVERTKGGYPVVHGKASSYQQHGCRCDVCRAAATEAMRRARSRLGSLARNDRRHGTLNGYDNYGCRCDDCREAKDDYRRRLALRRKAYPLPPDDPRHGTLNAYTGHYCRCDRCRAASAEYERGRRG